MSLRVVECRFVLSSVTSRCRIVTPLCRIVTSRCCIVAPRCRVSGWAKIQTMTCDSAIWHLTMQYNTQQHKAIFYKMSRSFSDFYTATPDNAKRYTTIRSDTQQCEAILDNAKRHSTMPSDILTNIVPYCLESTGDRSTFNTTPASDAIQDDTGRKINYLLTMTYRLL
jgi:hypothetical protein